jgi:ParB family chromosome partitioning protein
MSLKQQAQGRQDAHKIDPRILEVEKGFNFRQINTASDENQALKQSILANGVQKPLTVETVKRDGKERYFIRDGERRWRMTMQAIEEGHEIATVPVIGVKLSEEERVLHVFISNDGVRLNQIEQGEGFKRLVNFGWSEEKIAEKTGMAVQHIKNCLELHALPVDCKKAVFAGQISSSLLLELNRESKGDEKALRDRLKSEIAEAKASGKTKVTKKQTAKKANGKDKKSQKPGKAKPTISPEDYKAAFEMIPEFPKSVREAFRDFLNNQFQVGPNA